MDIYGNIYHQDTPVMLASFYHTWILWVSSFKLFLFPGSFVERATRIMRARRAGWDVSTPEGSDRSSGRLEIFEFPMEAPELGIFLFGLPSTRTKIRWTSRHLNFRWVNHPVHTVHTWHFFLETPKKHIRADTAVAETTPKRIFASPQRVYDPGYWMIPLVFLWGKTPTMQGFWKHKWLGSRIGLWLPYDDLSWSQAGNILENNVVFWHLNPFQTYSPILHCCVCTIHDSYKHISAIDTKLSSCSYETPHEATVWIVIRTGLLKIVDNWEMFGDWDDNLRGCMYHVHNILHHKLT